jgi:D-sedoheptulose 7-phosphate isomerase
MPAALQLRPDRLRIPIMSELIQYYINDHAALLHRVSQQLSPKIEEVGKLLCESFGNGGRLLTFGNGGSAADAQHFAEELIGKFLRDRRPLPATSLCADGTAMTCISNDFGYEEVFARQVQALARPGDVVAGFSTSGKSKNVLRGLHAAKDKGAITVGLLGRDGGEAAKLVDHAIIVPGNMSSHIQEMHVLIVHLLCDIVDRWAAALPR